MPVVNELREPPLLKNGQLLTPLTYSLRFIPVDKRPTSCSTHYHLDFTILSAATARQVGEASLELELDLDLLTELHLR